MTDNYFGYRQLLYRPYVKSLISLSGLKRGSRVLDAGCGQGLFSYLFQLQGMQVYSTDISLTGLANAKAAFGHRCKRFFVSDLNELRLGPRFDCVFVRSCSLFNTADLSDSAAALSSLRRMVTPGGLLLYLYNTNLTGRSDGWKHHRLSELQHFLTSALGDADIYLVNKMDILVLGRHAFHPAVTAANRLLSRVIRGGFEVVSICHIDGGAA